MIANGEVRQAAANIFKWGWTKKVCARRVILLAALFYPALTALAQTAARYPEERAKSFVRDVKRRLVVVDESRKVHGKEWTVEKCLGAAAQFTINTSFNSKTIKNNGRIKLSPEMAKFFDECLGEEGLALK